MLQVHRERKVSRAQGATGLRMHFQKGVGWMNNARDGKGLCCLSPATMTLEVAWEADSHKNGVQVT